MRLSCRACNNQLSQEIIDLGHQPPSNSYLTKDDLNKKEITYPMRVFVCTKCWLVQLPAHTEARELFNDNYAYFSSTSQSWCDHAKKYVYETQKKLNLNEKSLVIEIASNDGYLLQYFKKINIDCIGIEPTKKVAEASRKKGIKTIESFFGSAFADKLLKDDLSNSRKADLIIANNVIAHVPDLNDFIDGISKVLKYEGILSIEFPHLLNLVKLNQFDTIYHEHYSYFSLFTIEKIFKKHGLYIFDVETLRTHGGSLRIWLSKKIYIENCKKKLRIIENETKFGLQGLEAFKNFQNRALEVKYNLLNYLIEAKNQNKEILGFGAAAKGNTLLNFSGIKKELLDAVCDNSPGKHGKFLPGSHIPIINFDSFSKRNPDEVLVLPWNLIKEIKNIIKGKPLITFIPSYKKW